MLLLPGMMVNLRHNELLADQHVVVGPTVMAIVVTLLHPCIVGNPTHRT